jgi:ABC-2 type transport system ATP-binding protein
MSHEIFGARGGQMDREGWKHKEIRVAIDSPSGAYDDDPEQAQLPRTACAPPAMASRWGRAPAPSGKTAIPLQEYPGIITGADAGERGGRPELGLCQQERTIFMIEVQGLTKRYGEKTAVDGLTFGIEPGQVTGFLGPNGAGKTTTMRCVLGLDYPDAGTVAVDGRDYRDLGYPMREVGALLDAKAVHGGRSAYNHLLCLAQTNNLPKRRVGEVLELVGLSEVAKKRSKGFSLGMSQRLGIAATLLGDPRVLMFDEPVNGLDPEGILWIRNLMKALAAEGRTVFVSSHLMSEMESTADHLIVIGRGKLIADCSMSEFIARSSGAAVRVRTPMADDLIKAVTAAGATTATDEDGAIEVRGMTVEAIGDIAFEQAIRLHELTMVRASLEEAFMELTASSVEYHAGVPLATTASGSEG